MLKYSPDMKALSEEMNRALAGIDAADPVQRVAATLFVVLKNQLDLLGYAPGAVPFDERFGSVRCRGALLGTAVAVARGHRNSPEQQDYFDAIAAAFTIVFGAEIGPARARETIEQSGNQDKALNAAAEWANQDTLDAWSDLSATVPAAFYQAATEAA